MPKNAGVYPPSTSGERLERLAVWLESQPPQEHGRRVARMLRGQTSVTEDTLGPVTVWLRDPEHRAAAPVLAAVHEALLHRLPGPRIAELATQAFRG